MSEQTWAKFYKGTCENEEVLQANVLAHRKFILEIGRYIVPGDKVLEIGTGTGLIGWPLAQAGVKVISIDNDPGILEQAKRNAKLFSADIEYREADAFKLPFANREFKVSFSLGLLEHFSDADIARLVYEHQRVSNVVVVGMPLKGCKSRAFGNERWLTMEEWEALLKPMGAARGFIYGNGPCCCFTFIRPDILDKLPKRPEQ
jgi:2-polyprenyl-3-methyl-5-hydroxy-6-metoxy-1,4-benzoquinol methylase